MRRTTPEQTVFVDACETGQFAANEFKNFRVTQSRNEQAQLSCGTGGRRRRVGANIRSRAGTSLDQPFVLQVEQRTSNGGSRHAKLFHQLRLARQTCPRGV